MDMVGKFVQLVVQLGIRCKQDIQIVFYRLLTRMGMVDKFALLVAQLE
jgi:hypothetical protein